MNHFIDYVKSEIRRHWSDEFAGLREWDCNWAAMCGQSVIGPTTGEPILDGCESLVVDGVTFYVQ